MKSWAFFLAGLKGDDLVMITADHGNDPCTYRGIRSYKRTGPSSSVLVTIHERDGMMPVARTLSAVIGATITDNFSVPMPENTIGKSILDDLK